jgi:hypothetical protein
LRSTLNSVFNKLDDHGISDEQFLEDLRQLKNLRSFFIKEAVSIETEGTDGLAFATQDEWAQVKRHTQSLFRLMTEPLRRKFTLERSQSITLRVRNRINSPLPEMSAVIPEPSTA